MLFRSLFCVLVLLGTVLPSFAEKVNPQHLRAPIAFEPNRGQTLPSVRFLSRGNGHSFLLLDTEAVLMFADRDSTVTMKLRGQNPRPLIEGVDLRQSVTNYFQGNDPARWVTGVPHFAKVRYKNVYSGIDLVYYGTERQLEYDFEVQPRVDPSRISIEFHGAKKVAIGPEGDLVLSTPAGEIRHHRPVAFQRRGNEQVAVDARFVLKSGRVEFKLGRYDRNLPLTIDPKLEWSSYLGASGDDQANDVAVDPSGNVYVAGFTQTITPTEIPDPPPEITLTPDQANGFEAFVTKLDPSGNILFTTYFGGTAVEEAHSVAVDSLGNIYVTGYTTSTNFPVTGGAFQGAMAGVQDAYFTRLSNSGIIQFSSYLGGSRTDRAFGIALDSFSNAYIVGSTFGNFNNCTSNFPIVNAFQPKYGGGGPGCGLGDAFVTKVTPTGTLGFSTFLGGGGNDQAYDVAIDSDNSIIVTGFTSSQNFPVASALYPNYRGGADDVFITKFNSSGTALVFSTYFGGSDTDNGVRLAVDADKKIYVTGYTRSLDFPLKSPPQIFHNGEYDAFLIKMHADGQDADFSTYIGAEDTEGGVAIAVDQSGFIYLAGFTNSLQFYAINAVGGFLRGLRDAFILKMAPDGRFLVYSTYLGGFSTEGATSLALDSAGNAYVVGYTNSFDFPVATNAFQKTKAGSQDAFLVKINADDVKTTESYSFAAGGGVRTATAGQTASPVFGYVAIDIASGSLPSGLSIIDLRSAGTLINEVSIPIPPVGKVGRLYLSTVAGATTAITMVNPNDQETRVDFYFTPKGGETNTFGNFTLPAHTQTSGFLTAPPFNLSPDLIGTLTYTAELPVATTALLVSSGSTPTNVYLPIMNPYAANNRPLVIPQFVDGEGWGSQFYLINPTEDTITGEIRFFKQGTPGQPGIPAELATELGPNSVFAYSIEPRGLFTLNTQGVSPSLTVGFAHIVPSTGSNAPHAYETLVYSGAGFVSTTVESVDPTTELRAYVELVGHYPDNRLDSSLGLALANPSDTPATVTLTLTGFDGSNSGLSANVVLPPKGHLSNFLFDIPGFQNLPPSPYAGVLKATSPQPFTLAAFRARYNEQGTFLITATGPLKDVSLSPDGGPPNPAIIPHLVDGGGYATQIVVTSGPAGGAAGGAIRYLNPSGEPLNVAISPP